MSDETSTDKPLFGMVPTSDAYMQLAQQVAELDERVGHVEAAQPAEGDGTGDGDVTEDDLEALHGRVDRHRSEIEQIKRVINQIINFLGNNGIPKTPPAESADTMTPQNRNIVQ